MKIFSKHFPYISPKSPPTYLPNQAVCGIGGNLGPSLQIFDLLFFYLQRHPKIAINSTSYIYNNKAFGHTNQPNFYNASLVLQTSLCLRGIFSFFFYLERRFGRPRKRDFKNSPRTLDLDLIFFNNKKLKLDHIELPHKDYTNRPSVLEPLRFQLGIGL